jgi:hypothetical protein
MSMASDTRTGVIMGSTANVVRRHRTRNPPSITGQGGFLSVELRGLEPPPENPLTCENAEFDDAKARETTPRDLRLYRDVLTASTWTAASRPVPSGFDLDSTFIPSKSALRPRRRDSNPIRGCWSGPRRPAELQEDPNVSQRELCVTVATSRHGPGYSRPTTSACHSPTDHAQLRYPACRLRPITGSIPVSRTRVATAQRQYLDLRSVCCAQKVPNELSFGAWRGSTRTFGARSSCLADPPGGLHTGKSKGAVSQRGPVSWRITRRGGATRATLLTQFGVHV